MSEGGTPINQLPMSSSGRDESQVLDSIMAEMNNENTRGNPDMIPPNIPGGMLNASPQGMSQGLTPEQQRLMAMLLQQQNSQSFFTKKLVEEFKDPVLGASIFLILNAQFITRLMSGYIPGMVNVEGKSTFLSVIVKALAFILIFYITKKFV